MDLKSLIVGLLLVGSLLMLGLSLRKPVSTAVGAVLALLFALLNSGAACIFSIIYILFLMLYPEGTGGSGSGSGRFRVSAVSGVLRGKSYTLSGKATLNFGRDNCKVLFPPNAPGVSRHHCTLFIKNGDVYLVDNNSHYGTYLLPSMQRLTANSPVRLEDNSSFCLAARENSFVINKY